MTDPHYEQEVSVQDTTSACARKKFVLIVLVACGLRVTLDPALGPY
jgi:hypothetical protein